ncbi:uncharacterized protein [Cherax quadricarinatus]|uniref:uncharacterized protein n=1 Tax=Cherax quadricarinatus TaxID=27406 RepID=UPI00387EB698
MESKRNIRGARCWRCHWGERGDDQQYLMSRLDSRILAAAQIQCCHTQYFKFDFEQKTERHTELVIAAGEGDAKTMQRLLKTGVPLLPMAARADPLLHAIRHNQRDAVFLLLSVGAPLCNQSIEYVTPLEGAHNTLGLPAVFPALIRMAYSEKIQMEIQTLKGSKITGKEEKLLQVMESYQKSFRIFGNFSKFILESNNYEERSKKARDLLCTAAKYGLSLTCVLLGLEDVCIHPLQDEENPFKLAFLGNHFDTQVTLCRDMNMVPFTFSLPPSAILPSDLLQEYWVNERKLLDDICSGKHDHTKLNKYETNILKKYIEQLSKVKPNEDLKSQDITLERPDDFFLYLLAKHDLVYILYILYEKNFKDMYINRVVESFSECTMLHVASMYGRLNMIEYLLYRNPELDKVTLGKYSAAHLSAIGGHKECYQYILARMNDDQKEMKCNIQLTAAELMRKYEEFCSNCQMPLMTREEALHVKNETEDGKRAHELLYIKGNYLKITKPDDLIDVAVNNVCDEKKVNEIKDKIKIETEKLLESIEDKNFKGRTVLTGPLVEGNEIFHVNYVDFMYEVSPEYDIMCKSSESPGEGTIISMDLPLKGSTFREEFAKHIKKAIKNYVSKSSDKSDISIAPPFLLHTHKGVYIPWVWNHKYFCLLASYIVPTLKAKHSVNDREESVFITNVSDGWILRKYREETKYFKDLTEDDRKVWLACRLLRKITLQLWFAPRFSTKRYTQSWNTYSVGIEGLEERILKQLFKDEKNAPTECNKKSLFDRVLSVYSRAANKESGIWVPRPDDDFHGKALSVCGILEYLESLKKNDNF